MKILVIEDNATAANLYRAALTREGYQVAVATDGEAGLAAVATQHPDLVLLDLMLPKMPGLEVLRRIRSNPELAGLPVMVTSNAYTAPRLDELWAAGATQILTKSSISPKEIARVVRDTLDASAPRD
jgi:two-component system, OmpR family, phosphate regulon response regulator PhoB